MEIVITGFPYKPPSITFKTKIYHPNIRENGDIECCEFYCCGCSPLKWAPSQKIIQVLKTIRSILITPDGRQGFGSIGLQFRNNR